VPPAALSAEVSAMSEVEPSGSFSISTRPTTSAAIALIAATSLASCRSNS
jgi:hypothetical protein